MKGDFDGLDEGILELLPELQKVCGTNNNGFYEFDEACNISFSVDFPRGGFSEDNLPKVKITQEKGIVIGYDLDDLTKVAIIDVFVSNSTVTEASSVLTFQTTFSMEVNFTMSNVVFFPVFKGMTFKNTTLAS